MCPEVLDIGHNFFSCEGSQASPVCLSEKSYSKMSLGCWWNGTDSVRPKYWERSLVRCHCAPHKFRMNGPGIEVRPRGDRPAPHRLNRRFED
jgi:hypothetical protein